MQNIHLSTYKSHVTNQRERLFYKPSRRNNVLCLLLGMVCLCGGILVGSYTHMVNSRWEIHQTLNNEENKLPYRKSGLHYIYKDRVLPSISHAQYDDAEPLQEEEGSEIVAETEELFDKVKSEGNESAPSMSLQERLEKAMAEQQLAEESAK